MTPRRRKPDLPNVAKKDKSTPTSGAPKVTGTKERRRAPRFSCDLAISMHWGAAVLEGRVVDISAEGLFVTLDQPLWIGAGFTAQLGIEMPVQLECIVRRVEPFRGMGLSYSVPQQAGRDLLAALLGQLGRT